MNKIGFGFLRLPNLNPSDENSVDMDAVCALTDRFLSLGGNYFDTAYTYLGGNSELAIREALVKRYPRNRFRIADKLPSWCLETSADCSRFFEEQLHRCGVEYFDVYLLHGLDAENNRRCLDCSAFSFLENLKRTGKARQIGLSYHDSPELLDEILTRHPEMDYVQLQINYLDWENPSIQSRRLYEVAVKHRKKIIVMEPIKGGNLANPPEKTQAALRALHPKDSMAAWAIRFAQSLPEVEIVLSGMNAPEQIDDNMQNRALLNREETDALLYAAEIIRSATAIACTGCGYCMDRCPRSIPIPRLFSLYNEYARYPSEQWKMEYLYADLTRGRGRAADCAECGACEAICPQKLKVIDFLKKTAAVFEAEKK